MSSHLSSLLLVALMLLPHRTALAQPSLPPCEQEALRVDLMVMTGPIPEVCISPGHATALLFDSPLLPEQVELEDGGRFQVVESGRLGLLLVPSTALEAGERRKLSVWFADGAAPVSASFILVAHPTRSTRQVNVFRRPRTADSLQAELLRKETELRRLGEENLRLRGALSRAGGLVGLHHAGLMDERGISARPLPQGSPRPISGRAVQAHDVSILRSALRVAVLVDLENLDTSRSWVPGSARLTSSSGEELEVLAFSPPEPLPPGGTHRLAIEAKAKETEARGTYTLTLVEADGVRAISVEGITFPELARKH